MDLISDIGTDLALAFLVDKKFRQKIESKDAARLIDRIQGLLETSSPPAEQEVCDDRVRDSRASHA